MQRTGIYVLVGYRNENDDLPTRYIGQADGVRGRIDSHHKDKEFWDWAAVFVSTSGGLNRAHVTRLKYALVKRVTETGRCYLNNGNAPQEPALTEAEKADTQGFLKEIFQILPLVGPRAFEFAKAVAAPLATDPLTGAQPSSGKRDTIIVPAQKDGFEETFLGEDCWYAIRIAGGMLDKIKYIAAYRMQPVSAITHYAPVSRIELYGEGGKYKVVFSESAKPIEPMPYGDAPPGTMQSPRYTSFARLQKVVGHVVAHLGGEHVCLTEGALDEVHEISGNGDGTDGGRVAGELEYPLPDELSGGDPARLLRALLDLFAFGIGEADAAVLGGDALMRIVGDGGIRVDRICIGHGDAPLRWRMSAGSVRISRRVGRRRRCTVATLLLSDRGLEASQKGRKPRAEETQASRSAGEAL